jgi:hypothetical protein
MTFVRCGCRRFQRRPRKVDRAAFIAGEVLNVAAGAYRRN